ncbi:TonB-dependent receptor [Cellvibrio polysaccharolyticus]|uniref:TonB-dependent receptor n=1 Tax=Cellvibrio polysaccharolyticus TaxID=2082724 RepID=A0A928YSM2_9GAMM|nr:TonB-dependent receptor [Cellvibrio polysaccharolyticus]MBE8716561.1 TonB-dependent receptor [Cellvibrio polysaccharolyticus]
MFSRSVLSASIASVVAISSPSLFAQSNEAAPVEDVLVTGIRASMMEGVDIKRNSFQIVDAIVSEDIGKFPDNNVVEALQRISGVQVTDRGSGETSKVAIRGLDDVTTTINGRTIFTAAARSVSLADIPASLLKQVDVYKTRSASNIESGIAGQLDIKTQRPFDFDDSRVVLAGRAIYQDSADKTDPNISALFTDRWQTGIGEFGALVNLSFAETNYRDQAVTAGAMLPFAAQPVGSYGYLERIFDTNIWQPGLELGLPSAAGSTLDFDGTPGEYLLARDAIFQHDVRGKRERSAANISLQFAPDESSEYLFEVFYNGFRNESSDSGLFGFVDAWHDLENKPAPILYPGTNIVKERIVGDTSLFSSANYADRKTDSWVYALGGKWELSEALTLRSELVYQHSKNDNVTNGLRADTRGDIWVDFKSDGGLPAWKVVEQAAGGDLNYGDVSYQHRDLSDSSRWTMGTFYDNRGKYEGDAFTWTADGHLNLEGNFFKNVEFGLRFDRRTADDSYKNQEAQCSINCSFSYYDGIEHINRKFFDGKSDVPTEWFVPGSHWIGANADILRANYANDNGPLVKPVVERFFSIEEDTYNAYLQTGFETELGGRVLDGQIGFRYSGSQTDMTFFDLAVEGHPRSVDDASTSKVLPSMMLRYHLTDDLVARFAYTETLRRPNFGSLNANTIYRKDTTNIGYGTASGGNPDLKPVESKNIDISLEWYFSPGSSLYGTFFTRDIEGFIVNSRRKTVYENYDYIIDQPGNASNGKLKGLELGLVYFPESLPGILDGFGLQFSYTALDSSQDIPETNSAGEITGVVTRDIFGISDSSYSAVLAYEKEKLGARLSYVWRDDFLNNYEAAMFANPLGIYRKAEKSLDLQISYDVTDNLSITLDGTNLTNEVYQSYYQYPATNNFGSSLYSRTYALGARYSF